jgi:hypothetical protein
LLVRAAGLAVRVAFAFRVDAFALRVEAFFALAAVVPKVFTDDAFAPSRTVDAVRSRAFVALRADAFVAAFVAAFAVRFAARLTDAFTVLLTFPDEAPEESFRAVSRTVRVTETRADFRPGVFVSFFRVDFGAEDDEPFVLLTTRMRVSFDFLFLSDFCAGISMTGYG